MATILSALQGYCGIPTCVSSAQGTVRTQVEIFILKLVLCGVVPERTLN